MFELIRKEIRLELRNKYSIGSIFLYVLATIYTAYLSFNHIIHPATWNALFWIILLFGALNASGKSFSQESKGRQYFYYSLFSPRAVIISKIIYNAFLLSILGLLSFFLYSFIIHDLVQDKLMFLVILIFACTGLSALLTLVSGIAAKTDGNFSLMSVLSFPVIIPLLTVVIKVSKFAVDGLERSLSYPFLTVLLLLNLIVFMLAYLLFPYLWQD